MQFLFSYTHIKLNLKFLFPFIRLSCVSICYQWALIDPVGNHSLSMDTSNPNTYKIYSRRSVISNLLLYPVRNSNPSFRRERAMSLATRRTGQKYQSIPDSQIIHLLNGSNSHPKPLFKKIMIFHVF